MSKLSGKVIEIRSSSETESAVKIGESLRGLRKLSSLTQNDLASRLGIGQTSISKVEAGRGDVQFSTIRSYVEALGGKVRISAAFPGTSALSIHMLDVFDVELDNEDQLILPIFTDEDFRPQRDVVLSIKPQFTSRILAGKKTVELRRRFPKSAPKGTIAYIYSTSPERAMVGYTEISAIRELQVEEIWHLYSDRAYIERSEFDGYFQGVEQGFALELANPRAFEIPIELNVLREKFGFEPPQSFLYAKRDLRKAMQDESAIVSH